MFGAGYIDGRPDPGTRIDPDNPVVKSGNQLWPNRPQPFRSQPRSLALTPDGKKLMSLFPAAKVIPIGESQSGYKTRRVTRGSISGREAS